MKIKQKIISAAVYIISSALLLTGCNFGGDKNSSDTEEKDPQSIAIIETAKNDEETTQTDVTEEIFYETTSKEYAEKVNRIETEGILLPDGSRVPKETAKKIDDHFARFDYSFIRYARPIYIDSTISEIYDDEHESFYLYGQVVFPEYVKVKAGDVLKNGLKVKSAEMSLRYLEEPYGFVLSEIPLEGSVTWEGFLYCKFEDDFYYTAGDLYFYPDPTLNDFIPVNACNIESLNASHDDKTGFSFVQDSCRIKLGNIEELDKDISGYFKEQEYVKVKVTLTNIMLRYFSDGGGEKSYADIEDIEILS